MTKITRETFQQQMQGRQIDVAQAERDPNLAGVDVAKADLNRDGVIRGTAETDALFARVDRFDRNGDAASVSDQRAISFLKSLHGKSVPSAAQTAGPATRTGLNDAQVALGKKFAEGGRAALEAKTQAHWDAIDQSGVGTHYGDHSRFKTMNATERQAWIDENKVAGSTPPVPREGSCIGWAMENVGAAYKAAGMETRWNQIAGIVAAKGSKGTDLAAELKKDGWQAIYFNPDPRKSADGSAEHTFSAAQVSKGRPYYGVSIDGTIQGYRPASESSTPKDMSGLDKLKDVPFWFGLARGGMHTFAGSGQNVNEFHWDRMPNDKNSIEETNLKDFAWLSGLIMVPPGTWRE